jgi:hypothetical protein
MATIGIDPNGVTLSSIIRDHPRDMWIRELVVNAIESSVEYLPKLSGKDADIHIRTLDFSGLIADEEGRDIWKKKLCCLNYGGMDAQQLIKALQIGGSGKTTSLDANYGIGIKTSVLNWSDLVIVTYKNGVGHFAWLSKVVQTNGIDFKIEAVVTNDNNEPIEECTDWIIDNATSRGYNLDHDFTEVIILGKDVLTNTFERPYGKNTDKEDSVYLRRALTSRIWKLPEKVHIKLAPSANSNHNGSVVCFKTVPTLFNRLTKEWSKDERVKWDTITTNDGVKIHYIYDGPNYLSSKPNEACSVGLLQKHGWQVAFSGLVWRNEIYSTEFSNAWSSIAFRFGIQSKAQYFRIYVEYPSNMVTTDKYRKTLTEYRNGDVYYKFFNDDHNLFMIKEHMPEWFEQKTKETRLQVKAEPLGELKDLFLRYKEANINIKSATTKENGKAEKIKRDRNQVQNKPHEATDDDKPKRGKVVRNPKNKKQNLDPLWPDFMPTEDKSLLGNNFCKIETNVGKDGADVILYNPSHDSVAQIANQALLSRVENAAQWEESAKNLSANKLVVQAAAWLMINRSRLMRGDIEHTDFSTNIAHNTVSTYLDSQRILLVDSVNELIREQERNWKKTIQTEAA